MSQNDGLLAEKALLGCLLIDPGLMPSVAAVVKEGHLEAERNRTVYRAMLEIHEKGGSVDLVVVTDWLNSRGLAFGIGGSSYLTELMGTVQVTAHWENYADIVRRSHYNREIVRQAKVITEAPDEGAAVGRLSELVLEREGIGKSNVKAIRDVALNAISGLEDPDSREGIDTGFPSLDRLLLGMDRGELVTVGARAKSGKSAFLIKIMLHCAERGLRWLAVTGEMYDWQYFHRMLAIEAGVAASDLRTRRVSKSWSKITSAADKMSDWEVGILDRPRPSLHDIRKAARAFKPDVVAVDYLGRCTLPPGEGMPQRLSEFCAQLKGFAQDFNCLVLLACQLNRTRDYEEAKPPHLADLSGSGGIENESDRVILLWRPPLKKDEVVPVGYRKCEAIIEASRHGYDGVSVPLMFREDTVEFMEFVSDDSSTAA